MCWSLGNKRVELPGISIRSTIARRSVNGYQLAAVLFWAAFAFENLSGKN
jgi:hypothetical protein